MFNEHNLHEISAVYFNEGAMLDLIRETLKNITSHTQKKKKIEKTTWPMNQGKFSG